MTDQTPDFDSMSPDEIMAWMEALAVRQGATEGIINDVSNVEVAEIDPNSVDIADEYIPYGMDPEVWAKKKAAEDIVKAERLAVMKAEKEAKAAALGTPASAPPPPRVPSPPVLPITRQPEPEPEPTLEPASLDFMADLVGGGDDSSDLLAAISASTPTPEPEPEADMLGGLDFLSNLGQAASDQMGDFGNLDFSGLDALGMDEPVASGASLDWLESMVSDSPSAPTPNNASTNEMSSSFLPDTEEDAISETAVGRILDDPMDWLSDFAEDKPMIPAAAATPDLDALFSTQNVIPSSNDPETDEIRSALKQGSAQPDDVKAWMDSMLDKGLSRTDVSDEVDDDDESKPLEGEIPDWLVSQVGAPPDLSAESEMLVEGDADLPDWLTAPVSEEQTAEFEAIFTEASQDALPLIPQPSVLDDSEKLGLLDTGAIQVEMSDPWVEAFELERSERMGDTDQLADWYNTAQADLHVPTDAIETINSGDLERAAGVTLQPANLQPESELPVGEAQAVPVWLGGGDTPSVEDDDIPTWLQTDTLGQPASLDEDEDLPDWLKPQTEPATSAAEDEPMPDWLNKRVVTDEFAAMTNSPMPPAASEPPVPVRHPTEKSRRSSVATSISPSEIAQLLNAARGSLKMGDVGAMVEKYDALVRAQAALEEVTTDLAAVSRDPAHKSNPAVLRVYGDALMRQGKLQAALDTYRAALNLL